MYNILIVEDEKGIRETIVVFLKNQGYKVFEACNGKQGLDIINKEEIHLAIVDIMMPVMDGITMVIQTRKDYDFPIIFLSAKSEDIDKITGLNIGADDYVTKPFEPLELIARVNSNIRRYEQILRLKNVHQDNSHLLKVKGLTLDTYTKEVCINNESVRLTAKEYQILELLMRHPGRIFSAQEIYELIWQEQAINTETIMVHIRRLREKIEINPRKPEYIKVVWGIGYKMEKE